LGVDEVSYDEEYSARKGEDNNEKKRRMSEKKNESD
jgi:hypothetical protein